MLDPSSSNPAGSSAFFGLLDPQVINFPNNGAKVYVAALLGALPLGGSDVAVVALAAHATPPL